MTHAQAQVCTALGTYGALRTYARSLLEVHTRPRRSRTLLQGQPSDSRAARIQRIQLPKRARTCHQCTCIHARSADLAQPAGPDLSLLRPELQEQWHHGRNFHLGSIVIQPGSPLKVWWTCDQCPSGYPHEWMAQVLAREHMHTRCPFCSNRKLCHHNSLSVKAPMVAELWDKDKNDIGPDQIMACSHSKRHWRCSKCDHSWQGTVGQRVSAKSGCPVCIRKAHFQKQPSLTESGHPVMAEFDHKLNRIHGFDPDEITLGSRKMLYWICSKCPQGKLHRWQASPNQRIGNGRNCPYCSGRRTCSCNSLQTLCPDIAKEWDWEKNDRTPDQVTARSGVLAFWRTTDGRSWEQKVVDRTAYAYAKTKKRSLKRESVKTV